MKKLLRNDAEVALDDVTEACKVAADHYRTAARIAHDAGLCRFFSELGRERQGWAQEIEGEIRRLGNLPSAPDADREALDHLVTRLRAAFSEDERSALLHESEGVEKRLDEKIEAALREALSSGARALLKRVAEKSAKDRERLRLMRR